MRTTTKITVEYSDTWRMQSMIDAGPDVDVEIVGMSNANALMTADLKLKGPKIDLLVKGVTSFKLEHVDLGD